MAVNGKVRKCHICGTRPASNGNGYCNNCQAKLDADKLRKTQQKPVKFVTFRGVTIKFVQGKGDKLIPQLTGCNPEKLPKSRLINLDKYCPGYTREQVKKLKRLCLSFAK
jgi:hypothetical protein